MEEALALVVSGVSLRAASVATGVPASTIGLHFEGRGLVRERWARPGSPPIPLVVRAGAIRAVGAGVTVADAAREAGVSVSALWGWLREQRGPVIIERNRRSCALGAWEREEIRVGIEAGLCDAEIARGLGRHRGTIGREITANGGRERYRAMVAEARAARCSKRPKQGWTLRRPWLWDEVQTLIRARKSPESIAGRLRRLHPHSPDWWVSHEAIYQAIFVQAKPQLRKQLAACLRSGRAKRRPRGRASQSGARIAGMVNISCRPAEADDRAVPGHWEGDLIIGAGGKSAIATLIERTSRFGMILKLDNQTAEHVAARISEEIVNLPAQLFRSLTWDQGKELARHANFTVATGVPVYFCDPHSPWQRGSNENWNGLVRMWLPKSTDLSKPTQDELNNIAALINDRPRKIFEWETAAERFSKLVAMTS